MDSLSRAASAEDVVQALLDYLVCPLLPLKSSAQGAPLISLQKSIAKQVYAVVLLYNYYHRKHHPELEFLCFESFCKLIVTLKPSLMAHMKLMHQSDHSELDDQEKQLSLTEKAVLDACNMSLVLDASKDAPSVEGWPISKIAVLLIDSRKCNCLLLFEQITNGVWSVIEKDLDTPSISSESTNKRKQVNKKALHSGKDIDEDAMQQLAFSAVKEATGINQTDLLILKSHVVCSLSKEKAAARFYVVQSKQPINGDGQVPIKDAIESLQGPLVRRDSCSWMITPVVEYFHVLPYAGFISDWYYREAFSNDLQDLCVAVGNASVNNLQEVENPCDKEVNEIREVSSNGLINENNGDSQKTRIPHVVVAEDKNISVKEVTENEEVLPNSSINANYSESQITENCHGEAAERNLSNEEVACEEPFEDANIFSDKNCGVLDNSGKEATVLSKSSNGSLSMDVVELSAICPHSEEKRKNICTAVKVYHHQKRRSSSTETNINASASGVKVQADNIDPTMKSSITECRAENVDAGNRISGPITSDVPTDQALVPFQQNTRYLEKLKITLASKDNELSQTALRVLLRKRQKLSVQLRNIEDEIAVCDKKMQTILDGGEDDLSLKIDTVIDCCNALCLKGVSETQDETCQQVKGRGSPNCMKRKRLSEAMLALRSKCEDLDDICQENNWTLPKYHVFLSDGGFLARLSVKGGDFECSVGGDLHSCPREARESAAAYMIAELSSMASCAQ